MKRPKRKRTPQREMAAWKRRVACLLRKEARCPSCQRMREKYAGTNIPPVCQAHQRIRQQMAFS